MNEQNQCSSHPQADENKLSRNMSQIGNKILVLSGKGGVGKSTVAVNIAYELAGKGFSVGLLDIDLHGPSVPRMAGLAGKKCQGTETEFLPIEAAPNFKIMSVAFLLPDDTQATIWRGPMKYSVISQMLSNTQWGKLDYLVIDAPPGTGDEPLGIAEMVGAGSGAVLVTTPQMVATEDVRRCITFCEQVGLPIWGIVENMSGLFCPHCDKEISIFGNANGGEKLAEQTGVQLLGKLPIAPEIAQGADEGLSIATCTQNPEVNKRIDEIINRLLDNINCNGGSSCSTCSSCSSCNSCDNAKGKQVMKIAIPTAGGQLCMHFGHCEQFAFVTVDPESKVISGTEFLTPPPHEPGVIPKWVADNGGNLVIAGGMGQRAQEIFNQNGVEVVVGAQPAAPEAIVTAYLEGSLETGQNACDH